MKNTGVLGRFLLIKIKQFVFSKDVAVTTVRTFSLTAVKNLSRDDSLHQDRPSQTNRKIKVVMCIH